MPLTANLTMYFIFRTLLQQLTFFSKIRNPKNLHREPELYKLYLDLLSHRNSEVQKTALDCIMVYKHKYLIPYKENLYSLIDDRKFKDELSSFRIDKDTNIVQDIHRKDLIQIVLRIVFSKMMVKTGLRTGGKSSGQMRRLLVLRFLAGCQENEMMDFIHMIFKYCSKFLSDDPWSMVKKISDEVDLEKCIPPKRLQSTLNLIQVILDQFGGLMSQELLSYILKILFVIGATIYGILKQRSAVYNGYISVLKNLRSSSLTILKRFFEQFDTYAWTNNEINAVFSVFIWPWLNKLSIENVHTPTPLLKLCLVWCHNPRYYKLLVKYEEDQNEQCILKEIINVLMTEKLHSAVASLIMEMFEKLLSLKPDEEENVLSIETDNILPIADHILERLALKENLNYGSCILLPFIPSILQKLKKKLTNKNKGISAKETFILSRISELVWEPEICDKVLELLLPIVFKKACSGASEEIMIQLTTTIFNLTKYVNSPYIHVKGLAPLFSEVTSTGTRKLLCEILKVMSTKSEKVDTLSNVVSDLNAFDTRWVEQPDFDKRLDGFKQISKIIDDDNLELDLGVIAVYNCFYMIRNEKDLALRESSVQCLRNVVPYLIKKYQHTQSEKNYLLNDVLLDLIRRGITNKNEQYRHASISLLGHIARECPDSHITLSDLSRLSNKTDLEADFFENLLHLQLYRQTRALNRFSQHYQGEKIAPNVRTLTQFILPLTSSYLLVEKYAQKNSLIDSAVEALKTICKLLPWHQYESILKFYLGKLRYKKEFQRQLVKIVVAVLDAYHFDLSKAHVNYQNEIKQTLETEMNAVNKNEKEDGVEDNNEQKLEEILEGAADLEEMEQDGDEDEKIILPINRQFILSPSAAKRVIHSIQNILLPQLHRTMAELTQHEASHKVNRKKTGIDHEEEELQKVPISLAVVKLLQRLPTNILNRNLPGVFTKLCSFFKSHLESVRRAARETLQKIMCSLGPDYLGLLLNQMSSMLSHGFQVHVLVYTVHSVLVSLKELYKPGNIDKCLLTILELCKTDLFGAISEEKEVAKIGSKVSEAKSTKSFDTFQILAQYITEKCLMDLILPLKDVLMQTHSFKIVNKVQECLRRIALGLIDNTYISTSSLLVFAYGTSSESIPQFLAKSGKKKLTEEEKEKILREKTDCYIIPKTTTGRSGIRKNIPCTSAEANSHLLVEFGLKLCQFLLKREKLQSEDYSSFLDPFILVFKNCLSARHVKMCTLTLHCLSLILKFDLPSLQEHIKDIAKSVFDLLHKYAAAGLSKGDNFDLVVAAFKMVAILVRDVRYYNIETDQLKSLLLYAEQDLHDYERQATAFGLLKAIISRKLIIPEIHDVMKKVSELSITSELPHVRQHCRQVFHHFLLDYPLGKKLDIHLAFYLSQLNYEGRPGRESALEMIHSIISTFPIKVLKKHSGMFFVMLGARLVNDEAPECRKMVAKSLQLMLERIDKTDRDSLFDIVKEWFKEKKISHRRLAAQLCGLIVLVEKSSFEKRLPEITSDIIAQFTSNNKGPGRFVRLKPQAEVSEEEEKNIKPEDHHLFQVLQMLLKICAHCPSFLKNVEVIEILSIHIQCLLAYPHEWVRLAATQFIGYVLSVLNIQHLSTLLTEKTCEDKGYLYSDPQNTVKSLTLDLCDQLQAGAVKTELAEQVVKNLVFMARVLQNVPNEKTEDNLINLHWLTRRMRKIVNMEVVRASKSTILRTEVFKWIAGVVTTLDADKIKEELHNLLAPLVREMTSIEQSNAPLRQLGKEVGGIIKKKVGNEDYISMLSKLETQLNVRRAERKRERAQLAVVDPEAAAKKKIKLHEKKKEAKKRKIEEFKGKKSIKKKRKVVELDSSEVM